MKETKSSNKYAEIEVLQQKHDRFNINGKSGKLQENKVKKLTN